MWNILWFLENISNIINETSLFNTVRLKYTKVTVEIIFQFINIWIWLKKYSIASVPIETADEIEI